MTFQYCSDLHLELLKNDSKGKIEKFLEQRVQPVGDFLILAGDIGHAHRESYKHLLNWCEKHFKKTFVVMGNHEYYVTKNQIKNKKHTMYEVEAVFRSVCDSFPSVTLLQKQRVDFKYKDIHYIILGCTMWAEIPLKWEGLMLSSMNDYRNIYLTETQTVNPMDLNELHNEHRTWLFNELDEIQSDFTTFLNTHSTENTTEYKPNNEHNITTNNVNTEHRGFDRTKTKVIVVTHHAPSLRMDKSVDNHVLPCGYCSDMEHLIGDYIDVWVSGHTHEVKSLTTIHNTKLLSNCIGYQTQRTGFNPQAIF